jgi:hypothetical protein
MQEKIPFHNITPLESMIINLQEDGQAEVWKLIETIKLPLKRANARKLMAQAIKFMEKGEQNNEI